MILDSWERITKAMRFYEEHGFKYFDASWTVPQHISAITKPEELEDAYLGSQVLVGSAEQSFLSVYSALGNDIYYAVSPCFRHEAVWDNWHQPYFMKVELFSKNVRNFDCILLTAHRLFKNLADDFLSVNIDKTDRENIDITVNGIEVGSYMVRRREGIEWTCGTGLAEPRFTLANNIE